MSYGLLGEKLGHSFSKILHAQMDNDDYELISIARDKVDDYLAKADFDGINVTIPYKEVAMNYCEPDEIAREIGCVNTLVRKENKVYGYNTDCMGFAYLAASIGVKWKNSKVVIFGSGGTSKTASYVAVKSGASEVVIVSRKKLDNTENKQEVIKHSTYDSFEEWTDADIIVNTTPVGMYPNNEGVPIDLNIFKAPKAVLDVIYNPLNTRLVLEAKKRNIPATCGLAMLVAQGWYAEEIWKNADKSSNAIRLDITAKPDDEVSAKIEAVTENIAKQKRNIVLTGMPGSGKSTLGKKLAEKLDCKFMDTDEVFGEKFGIGPGEYINQYGSEAFRDKESEVVAELSKESGIVLATGGGAILREENRMALKGNGLILFLNREPNELATDGRPLSQKDGVMKLYEERMPIYKAFMDVEIPVSDGIVATLEVAMKSI